MSTILPTEIFQARRDAALASSKLLLDNSSYELRNAPLISQTFFDGRTKEVVKATYEAQQQRFLASTFLMLRFTNKSLSIPQELLKCLRVLPNNLDLNLRKRIGLKHRQSIMTSNKKDFPKNVRQFPSSKFPFPPQSSESQPFPLPVLPRPDFPVEGRLAHFEEQWEDFTDDKWVLSILPPLSSVPIKMSQSSSPLLREEIEVLLKKRAVERVQNRTRFLFPDVPCTKKRTKSYGQ